MKRYYADCDQFDNHRTGPYATKAAAIEAFWNEGGFSESEKKRILVYTRDWDADGLQTETEE